MTDFNEKYAWLFVQGFANPMRIIWSNEDDKEIEENIHWEIFDYRDQQDGKIKSLYFPTFSSAIIYIKYEG